MPFVPILLFLAVMLFTVHKASSGQSCPDVRQWRSSLWFTVMFVSTLFLLAPTSAFAQTNPDCVPPTTGLVSWWPGDRETLDLVGENHGKAHSDVTFAPGKVGQAFDFPGRNGRNIDIPYSRTLKNNKEFTVIAWVYKRTSGGGIVAMNGGTFDANFILSANPDASIGFDGTEGWCSTRGISVRANEWHLLAGTYNREDPLQLALYVDGKLAVRQGCGTNVPDMDRKGIKIGSYYQGDRAFNGLIDEFTIYSRALSSMENEAIYVAGSGGVCKELSIVTPPLPVSKLGEPSSHQFEAVLGTQPYTWTLTSGVLPTGMSLDSSGILNGTPAAGGVFTFTIGVTDADGQVAQKSFQKEVLLTLPPSQIEITKFGTTPVPGRVIDYYILLENNGTEPTESGWVSEVLQPWFTFESANPPPTEIRQTAHLLWKAPPLLSGERYLISYRVRLSERFAESNVDIPIGTRISGGPACWSGGDCLIFCGDQLDKCFGDTVAPCQGLCGIPATFTPQGKTACAICRLGNVSNCVLRYDYCMFDCLINFNLRCDRDTQPIQRPVDPNEKFVSEKFIQSDQNLLYTIHYENISEVEAKDVFITDVIDSVLDLATVEVFKPDGEIVPLPLDATVTLLEQVITKTISIGGQPVVTTYTQTWDVSLDAASRTILWNLLNVNVEPGQTDSVIFSIYPRKELTTGAEIRNAASIQFEIFETLTTSETLTTIDEIAPTCTVDPLPAFSGPNFSVAWRGTDPVGEVESYSVFVSTNGGEYQMLVPEVDAKTIISSTLFTGEIGYTYEFICIARDSAGNVEVQDPVAEATTTVARMSIQTQIWPPIVRAGTELTYTVTISNLDLEPITHVQLVAVPPTGAALINAITNQGICYDSVSCLLGTLESGEVATVTVAIRVNVDLAGSTLTSVAQVFGDQEVPNSVNTISVNEMPVMGEAYLELVSPPAGTPAVAGESVTYAVDIINHGPSDAKNVTMTVSLPLSVTYLSDTGDCILGATSDLTCSLDTVAARGHNSIQVSVYVDQAIVDGSQLFGSAVVTTTTPTHVDSVLTGTYKIQVATLADLAIDLGLSPTLIAGKGITLTLIVDNWGPSDAKIMSITLGFSIGIAPDITATNRILSALGWMAVGYSDGYLHVNKIDPVQVSKHFELPVILKIAPSLESGTLVEFTGAIDSKMPDHNHIDNVQTIYASIIGVADLAVNIDGMDMIGAGQAISYTITISNNGPSTAHSADLVQIVPREIIIDRVEKQHNGAIEPCGLVCQLGDIAPNSFVKLLVHGIVDSHTSEGVSLASIVTLDSPTYDPDITNNRTHLSIVVEGASSTK